MIQSIRKNWSMMDMRTLLGALVTSFLLITSNAYGMGKKPQKNQNQTPGTTQPGNGGNGSTGSTGGLKTPTPVYPTVLETVKTLPFTLPNGSQVNLSSDLQAILTTAVTDTPTLAAQDKQPSYACDHHLELRAAVSTLEFNITELGLTFGYNPGGAKDIPITNLEGKLNVKLGTLAMDFALYECFGTRCTSVASSTANHTLKGVGLSLEIDFGTITTGPSLVHNTSLGKSLRKIMDAGIAQMAASARLSELSWQATVKEYHPDTGVLLFDAGQKQRLEPNQSFVVYSARTSEGACQAYKPLATIHTTQVYPISSYAVVDQILDGSDIQPGDIVLVYRR